MNVYLVCKKKKKRLHLRECTEYHARVPDRCYRGTEESIRVVLHAGPVEGRLVWLEQRGSMETLS